jgi:hypothetical protein
LHISAIYIYIGEASKVLLNIVGDDVDYISSLWASAKGEQKKFDWFYWFGLLYFFLTRLAVRIQFVK